MEPAGAERHRREARRVSELARANQTPYNSPDDSTRSWKSDWRYRRRVDLAGHSPRERRIINDADTHHTLLGRDTTGDWPGNMESIRCRSRCGYPKTAGRGFVSVCGARRPCD